MAYKPFYKKGIKYAQAFLVDEHEWYYLTHCWGDKGVHAFAKTINLKVNVTVQLEFELIYFEAEVQHINHYARVGGGLLMKFIVFDYINLQKEFDIVGSSNLNKLLDKWSKLLSKKSHESRP